MSAKLNIKYTNFLDLSYVPKKNDVLAAFYVEPASGTDIKEAAGAVASESSIGTWTDLATMKQSIWDELRARVYSIEGNIVRIAYPDVLFEAANLPQFLSSVAGNVFGMKAVENLRLLDIVLTQKFLDELKGPAFGVDGVREVLGVKDRPLVGTIVKPKLGLDPKEQAKVVYESLVGGLDLVKDDENLTHQDFSNFDERVKYSLDAVRRAEEETGEKKAYLPNVTAPTEEMLRRTALVKKEGGKYAMVDVITTGFAGVQSLRNANSGLILHAHRAMYASFARSKKHGIHMLVLSKLLRFSGVDQLHIGTVVGKMEGDRDDVLVCHEALGSSDEMKVKTYLPHQEWGNMKSVFSVASGGLHPGHTADLFKIFGKNAVFQYGGGVHGHPEGTRMGARAVRDSVECAVKGISLKEGAKSSKALELALSKWGGA
ncbi:ribulose bisphosphate carboxylase, type III [Thermodesulfobium narugense DSM 14796]|uniref:Ribulose bisphosphate carboxylase, type III n=1 Tax=Thermodesulfobium narugense DSM 14796 TaxID=747365 RepID=M1E6K1_9BACT|nr:type III ribulose-bisphosphate carboxylase [Thermodesulfobium narugense]AEE14065.1 ribulose bisphosphate carboxylase, type III [Thermodesulfobium narugense DSM 14796]